MLKFLWHLLILGLMRQGAACFVQNDKTVILHGHTRRATRGLPDTGDPISARFGTKLKGWRHKMFPIFRFS